MMARLLVGVILIVGLSLNNQIEANRVDSQLSRSKRDTAEWIRRQDAPILQDFRNGTFNNATSSVYTKCYCQVALCECYAEFQDFNNTKLHFRIEHVKDYQRFKVSFNNENKTISQQFILVNGTSCFQFKRNSFDQVCFWRYGSENNTILDKACIALGVRIQRNTALSMDYECVKYMADGTTHVGPLNISSPDLQYFVNYTLYGAATSNNQSMFLLFVSILVALTISKYES